MVTHVNNYSSILSFSPVRGYAFESLYVRIRKREGRIYNDKALSQLPEIGANHQLYKEWRIRKNTADKLIKYLSHSSKEANLLEVGCGNGWLINYLHKNLQYTCLGVDLNFYELKQAQRVFGCPQLKFGYADIFDSSLPLKHFDLIVFAASIQYFQSLDVVFDQLKKHLTDKGRILILDSPLYNSNREAARARQRSLLYYQAMGVEKLSESYHHHTWNEVMKYKFRIIYNPKNWVIRIRNKFKNSSNSPFPIIEMRPLHE